jgi:phosphoenolpyruvate-protein phosphotransferase
VTLVNPAGLHFGHAVLFVQTAARYPATITVRNLTTGAGPIDARRFNQVLGLGAEQGHRVEIRADGPEAEDGLQALVALAEAGFGEGRGPAVMAPAGPATSAPGLTAATAVVAPVEAAPAAAAGPAMAAHGRRVLHGIAASPGAAVGTAFSLAGLASATAGAGAPARSALSPDEEWARYQAAVAQAGVDLNALAERMARELGPEQSRIFQAHEMALQDPDFVDAVRAGVYDRRWTAESAVAETSEAQAKVYEAMSGARFRERAADMRDVGARVIRLLSGQAEQATRELPQDAIVLAQDLAPSQTAALDRSRVVAFCTALGGPTAHSAILARSMGIPAVVGLGSEAYAEIPDGARLAIDGTSGTVVVEPDEETVAAFQDRQAAEARSRTAAWTAARGAAHTADGKRVEVVCNLATAADAAAALEAGAEGVGLLRTEFLFQDRIEPPTEEEQYAAYRAVAEAMAPRPVIIRTLDIGCDKPAPYLRLPPELNPFLGWRAIRVCLAMPDFFKVQLRAILRAATGGNVLVMFPMIAQRSEVEQARALLAESAGELSAAGVPHASQIRTGIMVEVPAAAETPDLLAPVVDFFSIGTNDLTQYTFAADRGNAKVAGVGDPLHPAVLRQIGRVIDAAHAAGKWVGLCGELAGQPDAIPVLLGLGLDEFSMSATSIPRAKEVLAHLTVPEAQALARRALSLPDAAAVRAAVAGMK